MASERQKQGTEKESETDNRLVDSFKSQDTEVDAAEAGNKMTNAQRHKSTTQMFLSF